MPRKPKHHLRQEKSQQQRQKYLAARQIKRHHLPLQNACHADGQRGSNRKGITGQPHSVRRDRNHQQRKQEHNFQPQPLRIRPAARFQAANLKTHQARKEVQRKRPQADDPGTVRVDPKKKQDRQQLQREQRQNQKQIAKHLRPQIERRIRQRQQHG